jgi:N-acylneuraminate cytidylyltransferase
MKVNNKIELIKNLGDFNIGFYELNEIQFQDIDTETDWKMAELKYKLKFN